MLESIVKRHVFTLLSYQKEFFGWVETTMGIWDEKNKAFRKRTGTGMRSGVSDVVGLWNGRGIALEIKTEKGRLTEGQIDFLSSFRRHGGIAAVLRSLDDTELLLSELRRDPIILSKRLTPFLKKEQI